MNVLYMCTGYKPIVLVCLIFNFISTSCPCDMYIEIQTITYELSTFKDEITYLYLFLHRLVSPITLKSMQTSQINILKNIYIHIFFNREKTCIHMVMF